MIAFRLGLPAIGLALLAVVLARTDLAEVWSQLCRLGWGAIAAIFAVHAVGFVGMAASWLLTLPEIAFTPRWLYRFWQALMVGHAYEKITPFASLGGDPIKAILLKRHYGIPYREATASLVLNRTSDLAALIAFVAVGFALMLQTDALSPRYRLAAGSGLGVASISLLLFFAVQRHRGYSRLRGWLESGWLRGRRTSARVVALLDAVHDVENRLVAFYSANRRRLSASVLCALAEWSSGALVTWLALDFLGHPVSFGDAVIIESFLALVLGATFFIPANIGTQEAALVVVCAAVTGSAELGLALAALRRARDLVWIAWGLAIGSAYSLRSLEVQIPTRPEQS